MRYKRPSVREDGKTAWIQPVESGYKFSCCDCGLVHNLDFRVEGDRAQFRVSRNNRATAAVRRERRKKQ